MNDMRAVQPIFTVITDCFVFDMAKHRCPAYLPSIDRSPWISCPLYIIIRQHEKILNNISEYRPNQTEIRKYGKEMEPTQSSSLLASLLP
jgi:hypothetical protein